jgi:hypothetical protein
LCDSCVDPDLACGDVVNDPTEPRRNSLVGGFAALLIRGVLLWVLLPIAMLGWFIVRVIGRGRGVTLGQFIGWCDINLMAGIQRSVLRPLFRWPVAWVPVGAMPQVAHRVRLLDPA